MRPSKRLNMFKILMRPYEREAFTVTFGDVAENERGMQMIGKQAKTFVSVQRLRMLEQKLVASGTCCKLIDLSLDLLPTGYQSVPKAAVLVIYGGVMAGLGEDTCTQGIEIDAKRQGNS